MQQLILLDEDVNRLKELLQTNEQSIYYKSLREEILKAAIVPKSKLPKDVVIMNSTVKILDIASKERDSYTLVFPQDADIDNDRISILAPIGTALLGYRKGDVIRWAVPSGMRSLTIEDVKQPA